MNYTAKLIGEINSQPINVIGEGTIIEGITQGNYKLINVPINFNPLVLQGLLVTGYPNACHSIDQSINVFKGASYTYERTLTFNNGGKLDMQVQCNIDGDNLTSIFEVNGEVQSGELLRSEPIIETWEPLTNNKLHGLFRIAWKQTDDNFLSADAYSKYSPNNSTENHPVLHRYIEISAKVQNDIFSLRQDSKLFHRLISL